MAGMKTLNHFCGFVTLGASLELCKKKENIIIFIFLSVFLTLVKKETILINYS